MNNIYVETIPKDCSECPMCRSGNLKLQRKGRYVEAKQCVFGQYKYQTIDDEIDTCPLKLLSTRLAEERKKVVQEIRKFYTTPIYDKEDAHTEVKVLLSRLDQIERGE